MVFKLLIVRKICNQLINLLSKPATKQSVNGMFHI